MKKMLFEEMSDRHRKVVNQFLYCHGVKVATAGAYDGAKDKLVDEIGSDVEVLLDGIRLQISTQIRDTIDWRTAFVNLARIMAAEDDEQKQATKDCTNSTTSVAVRVLKSKRREVK